MTESRHYAWDGCLNARDLGGLPTRDGGRTRSGVLVRGDSVCELSADGRRAMVEDGVRTVVDLRGPSELERTPNPFAVGGAVRYLHLPLNDEAVEERLRELPAPVDRYVTMVDADGARLAAIVDALATAQRATLVHCLAGRDRTGIVTAVVLRLVGCADEVIEDDYVLSDARLLPRYDGWRANLTEPTRIERFDRAIAEARDSIRAVLHRLEQRWGGVESYLEGHGLARSRMAALRAELSAQSPPSAGS